VQKHKIHLYSFKKYVSPHENVYSDMESNFSPNFWEVCIPVALMDEPTLMENKGFSGACCVDDTVWPLSALWFLLAYTVRSLSVSCPAYRISDGISRRMYAFCAIKLLWSVPLYKKESTLS
jgi:hypothetical protein